MKCQKCNKNEANFHSVTKVNGKVTEKHLCSKCAKNEKEFQRDFLESFRGDSIFDDFFSDFKTTLSYFTNPFTNFSLDFDDENKKVEPEKISDEEKKANEIKKLDLELKKAVVEERYEDAIVLRDKIKKLKNDK